MAQTADKMMTRLKKFKYPLLALALGLVIMLLPTGVGDGGEQAQDDEQRLAAILENCEGVGSARVLLSENGVVIVCDGAENSAVKLCVIKAAEAFTGFSSDRIQVIKTAPNIGG